MYSHDKSIFIESHQTAFRHIFRNHKHNCIDSSIPFDVFRSFTVFLFSRFGTIFAFIKMLLMWINWPYLLWTQRACKHRERCEPKFVSKIEQKLCRRRMDGKKRNAIRRKSNGFHIFCGFEHWLIGWYSDSEFIMSCLGLGEITIPFRLNWIELTEHSHLSLWQYHRRF